jgi:hypothetical protein
MLTVALVVCYAIVWLLPNTQQVFEGSARAGGSDRLLLPRLQWRPNVAWALCLSGAFFAVLLFLAASNSFLYFQF